MPLVVLLGVVGVAACTRSAEECTAAEAAQQNAQSLPVATKARDVRPDLSGCKRTGVASFYADMFTGREMADGTRMDPNADNAASRTLPLGTTAKVTNLETGQSAEVTIQDRGPYVKGRIHRPVPCDCARDRARSTGRHRHGRSGADRGAAARRRDEARGRGRRRDPVILEADGGRGVRRRAVPYVLGAAGTWILLSRSTVIPQAKEGMASVARAAVRGAMTRNARTAGSISTSPRIK